MFSILITVETSRADGLRAEVVSYMMDHYDEYKNLDLAVINSNMPDQFASIDERIIAMTDPHCLQGELEIVASSKVLKKNIVVLGENMNEITSYGDSSLQKLYVRFKNIGQDVGHYDSLVLRTDDHANLQASSQTANQSRENNLTTPPARSLKNLLKEPTILKRKRGGRC